MQNNALHAKPTALYYGKKAYSIGLIARRPGMRAITPDYSKEEIDAETREREG